VAYIVGLTGGIGCGKSTAANLLAELGAHVIDTDTIAHRLTAPGAAALNAIAAEFGPDYLSADSGLNRAKMRHLIFSDPAAKARLEAILHPLIKQEVLTELAGTRSPYVVLVVPLLLETGSYRDLIQRVLVVDCEEQQQIERTTARSALDSEEVRAIMSSQLPRQSRLLQADDVLRNQGDLENLRSQVAALHSMYLQLAQAHP
jgi:dephospho-CoA kinase